MVTNMRFFRLLVFLWAVYSTSDGANPNVVVPNCDCVPSNSCHDTKRNPLRCGNSGLVCCERVSSTSTTKPAVIRSSTTPPQIQPLDSLFGTADDTEVTSRCGVATTQFNYELKESNTGEYANENEFPWVLEIFQKEGNRLTPECAAVLTDYRVAITTAHCVADLNIDNIIVRAGDNNLVDEEENFKHAESKVLKIITHPKYNPLGSHNNIAVLMLDGFKNAPNINTICTPEQSDFTLDSQCYVAGWGQTEEEDEINPEEMHKMKKIRLRLISGKECTQKLRATQLGDEFELSRSALCAVPTVGLYDSGLGFGGAPLFCLVNKGPLKNKYFSLLGITSWRPKNSPGAPGVYTAFPRYLNWTKNASMDFFATFFG